ncbi:MAG: aminopeptidase [Bacteroidales bacterium]|jgi:bleomycin hydrolase|nr:aminopeptidase [Bacteroidales bacterium]
MNRHFLFLSILVTGLLLGTSSFAQEEEEEEEGYKFTLEKEVPVTPVKDQYRSGTCWSFSGIGFIESELLRLKKGEYDLSDMFVVRKAYEDKAKKYIRMHGTVNFSSGGVFADVSNVIKNYGIVPEEAYPGLEYGEDKHIHGEIDKLLNLFVDAIKSNPNKKITPKWFDAYNSVLDTYFGEIPDEFVYNGKKYTPQSFANEIGFKPEDYINITSYTHHPFYEQFILEIPDNWSWSSSYNLPMDEMMSVLDNAVNNGFTVCWGADVSEKGFKWTKGVAIIPAEDRPDLDGLERDKWEKLSVKEKEELLYKFDKPVPEKEITQEIRQEGFDNYQTTDDHSMIICGIGKDQNGTKYYYVKNSWNINNTYDGFFYASESYVKYKTMNIIVHKDAVPKNIKQKLNIK